MAAGMEWDELPAGLRQAVAERTGEVLSAERVAGGLNSPIALTITTKGNGPLFLKGVRDNDADAVMGLRWEELVNPAVRGIGPTIRHSFRAGGWLCLAFIHIDGRHADLSPGSADLAAVTFTLQRLRGLRAPEAPLPRFGQRFAAYLKPGETEALTGRHLLHTDTNPYNIMVGRHGGNAYLVDWAMPAIGPSWIDPAYTAVRLMECGQSADDAIGWLSGFPHWRRADPKAVETFVQVICRHWAETVGEPEAETRNERFRQLLDFPHESPAPLWHPRQRRYR
ncbi:aminoglycoside phosphotransferase [Streptomyces sp. NPDC055078]